MRAFMSAKSTVRRVRASVSSSRSVNLFGGDPERDPRLFLDSVWVCGLRYSVGPAHPFLVPARAGTRCSCREPLCAFGKAWKFKSCQAGTAGGLHLPKP